MPRECGKWISRSSSIVVPSGPRERVVQRLKITEGTTNVSATLRGWLPTTEKSTFWLTSNPYGESFDHLKYLVHYPHGCVEQTTSSTRPLLYVSQLVGQVDPSLDVTRRNAGPFAIETPADWTFEANENRAGGYDVFLRAPSASWRFAPWNSAGVRTRRPSTRNPFATLRSTSGVKRSGRS